jgi:hypothetical protein
MAVSLRRNYVLFLAVLVLSIVLVSYCVDAASPKKGAKSSKKSSAKTLEKKAAPSKKDWNKMTEEEWNAAEQEALDPEDRCCSAAVAQCYPNIYDFFCRWKPLEPPKPPDVPFDPKHPEKFMAAQKKVFCASAFVLPT